MSSDLWYDPDLRDEDDQPEDVDPDDRYDDAVDREEALFDDRDYPDDPDL